jgi:dolichol-phosphate mannosyltransferase
MARGELVREGGIPAWTTVRAMLARARDWVRFGLVGFSGLGVNQVAFLLLTELLGVWYLASAVIATIGSSTWNFILADRWVFSGRELHGSATRRWAAFTALNFALLPARLPVLWFLTDIVGWHYSWSNLVSLLAMFAVRMLVADNILWRAKKTAADTEEGPMAAETTGKAPKHAYDVAGLLSIHTDVELRELKHFKVAHSGAPDIRITVGNVVKAPRRRVEFEERGEELIYREHLGMAGANFSLRMGTPIEIRVSPLMAMSPHVVYTNIVEAFLRFLLVSKGYVLLHSAAIADEQGVTILSAQTDTGKTSTVISLVRSRGYRFLSDDMTIIDPRGRAISYPKPMTLSFHTMRVAKAGKLTLGDRAKLSIQSRLHSKSGRSVGQALGQKNLPIMTMNSIVQAVVPPPKHRIEKLFECVVGGEGEIRNVVLLSKGEEWIHPSPLGETVDQLIDNTDDAYGFPPFATFAPRIRIGDDDYASLRRKERELLALAMASVTRWQLSVKGYGWADVLPSIMDGNPQFPAKPGAEPVSVPVVAPVPVGVMAEEPARIPVPVFEDVTETAAFAARPVTFEHPARDFRSTGRD